MEREHKLAHRLVYEILIYDGGGMTKYTGNEKLSNKWSWNAVIHKREK